MGGDDGHGKAKQSKCAGFKQFLYDSNTGAVLGRTGGSWAKILLFYAVYYAGLAAFFAICMIGFFQTLDDKQPTQINMHTPLKLSPGMGFRPKLTVESTLIHFNPEKKDTYAGYTKDLDEFLKPYHAPPPAGAINCSYNPSRPLNGDETCAFPLSELGEVCTPENSYGYKNGSPCVLLKINRIYNWMPVNYDAEMTTVAGTVVDTEDEDEADRKGKHPMTQEYHVRVTCAGQHDADADSIKSVRFFPDTGFPFSYYPYVTQNNYTSPLVMAQFEVKRGGLIVIECKVWAKNIGHHRVDRKGSVVFELLVD